MFGLLYQGVVVVLMKISIWFIVCTWLSASYLFNPTGLEWDTVAEDWKEWNRWIGKSGNIGGACPNECWELWWDWSDLSPMAHLSISNLKLNGRVDVCAGGGAHVPSLGLGLPLGLLYTQCWCRCSCVSFSSYYLLGFVVSHCKFVENYNIYSRSHFTKVIELMMFLIVYEMFGPSYQGVVVVRMKISIWFTIYILDCLCRTYSSEIGLQKIGRSGIDGLASLKISVVHVRMSAGSYDKIWNINLCACITN